MARVFFALVFVLGVGACSGGGGGTDGGGLPNMCGEAPNTRPGPECTGLAECGAGQQNYVEVVFCENCPRRADSHLCEAGCCRLLEQNLPQANLLVSVPAEATGALSFTVTSFVPVMADGQTLTCAKLLDPGFQRLNNPALNAVNSAFKRFSAPADPGMVYQANISVDPGEGRMIFIQATTEIQGKGDVVAVGCVQDVEVAERVAITLQAP